MDQLNDKPDGRKNVIDGKRYLLKNIITHPDYLYTYMAHSDVALLQLRDEIEYSDNVQPICLPNGQEPSHGERCHITGWGYTGWGLGRVLSRHWQHATIPIVNFDRCNLIYYKLLKEDVHMCAGDVVNGGVDACDGDAGGPLTCQDPETKVYYLAGVTSAGLSQCGMMRGHLGIYTRMVTFENWIRDTVMNA